MWVLTKENQHVIWCNGCRGPLAVVRDGIETVPVRRAAQGVVDFWESMRDDDHSLGGWEFDEGIVSLKEALEMEIPSA
jgi:hypothetical protein